MILSRKTALVGAVISIFACHDVTAPPDPPAGYVLDNINGRPLPTFFSPIPEAPTILSATIQLYPLGTASLTESRRESSGSFTSYTTNYTYTITGNQIQFDYEQPCPANALCVAPPQGIADGSRLILTMYGSQSGIVYVFRYVGSYLGLD